MPPDSLVLVHGNRLLVGGSQHKLHEPSRAAVFFCLSRFNHTRTGPGGAFQVKEIPKATPRERAELASFLLWAGALSAV